MSGPLPSSGPLSLTDIQDEFLGSAPIGLSEYYRGGPYVPDSSSTATIPTSGAIAVSNFYGTRRRIAIPLTISSPTYNYDVYTNRGPSYVAGISDINVTVNSGVRVGSTGTGTYAMLVPSSFNAGDTVTITNNGYIQGMGGKGGNSQFAAQPSGGNPGNVGGNALYINRPTTIQNNSIIAGGGGGGGGGAGWTPDKGGSGWGGGGGGGAGYNAGAGGDGPYGGNAGTYDAGGTGGPGDTGIAGGTGGGRGAAGATGNATGGANPRPGGPGGSAGNYIVGNPFVTWSATGTREGGAS